MVENDPVVNRLIARYERSLNNMEPDNPNKDQWVREKNALEGIMEETKYLRSITKPVSNALGDLSDLPPELIAELSATRTDDLENQVFTIINAAGGSANIDTLLIELFRRFNVNQKRRYMTNKLWRMTQKDGVLWTGDEKGVYTTAEPEVNLEEDSPKRMPGGVEYDLDEEIPF